LIKNPQDWAKAQFQDRFGDSDLVEFTLDLDRDGVPELFLGAKSSIGNGGGEFWVFKKTIDGYLKIGNLGLHPKAIRTLPPKAGKWRFATFWHMSAGMGTLAIYSYDGRVIRQESSKEVNSSSPIVSYICRSK